jgi:hypothetical protein
VSTTAIDADSIIIPTKSERMIRLLLDRKATDDAYARASWV